VNGHFVAFSTLLPLRRITGAFSDDAPAQENVMAAPAFALLLAIQVSSMPSVVPQSPGIWNPPKSSPAPAPILPETTANAVNAGALTVSVRREIRAELRNGQISRAQARAFRRDLEAFDGYYSQVAVSGPDWIAVESSLEALDSLVYAAGATITPR
jgi:hypothetical protein